jgi:hypothetical protein
MSYSDLPAKGSTDTFSSTDWTNIKDNFDAGVPAIMTTKGDIAAASASQVAARLAAGNDYEVFQSRAAATLGVEWSARMGVILTGNTNTGLANATEEEMSFVTETLDTNSYHAVSPNPGRITFTVAGVYLIGGSVVFASNATGYRYVGFTGDVPNYRDTRVAINGAATYVSFAVARPVTVSEYATMVAYQTSGGALGISDAEFWAMRLR